MQLDPAIEPLLRCAQELREALVESCRVVYDGDALMGGVS